MIRVSVQANDIDLVDVIAAIVAREIRLDLLHLSYCLPRNLYIFETFQLGKPGMDQMAERVRDLNRTWLQKREAALPCIPANRRPNDQRTGSGERIALC
jgi:hypothetical protein